MEKESQLNELLSSDLPSKLVNCKHHIVHLQKMLLQRENERHMYMNSTGKQSYQSQMLEKQSEEIVNLREKVAEYDRRE